MVTPKIGTEPPVGRTVKSPRFAGTTNTVLDSFSMRIAEPDLASLPSPAVPSAMTLPFASTSATAGAPPTPSTLTIANSPSCGSSVTRAPSVARRVARPLE